MELTYGITEEKIEKGKLFGEEDDCLFKLEDDNVYRLDANFDVICEDAFAFSGLKEIIKEKKIEKVNLNKVKLIKKGGFNSFDSSGSKIDIYFDPDDPDEGVRIEKEAFGWDTEIRTMSGFNLKKISLSLYVGSLFLGCLEELNSLSIYLRGEWTARNISNLKEKCKGDFEIYDNEYKLIAGQGIENTDIAENDNEIEEIEDKERTEVEEKVEDKERTEVKEEAENKEKTEEDKYKIWDDIKDKGKMISFVIDRLLKDKFRIRANIDINKAEEEKDNVKLPKECFIDIKLVSADEGITEILKLLSKPRENEDDELLRGDPRNRNLAKNAVKEYIKENWDEIVEKGIEHDIKIVNGNIEKKVKNEETRKKFLGENNASKKISGEENIKIISKKERKEISPDDVKNVIRSLIVIAKESKKKNKYLYEKCKKCIEDMKDAEMNWGNDWRLGMALDCLKDVHKILQDDNVGIVNGYYQCKLLEWLDIDSENLRAFKFLDKDGRITYALHNDFDATCEEILRSVKSSRIRHGLDLLRELSETARAWKERYKSIYAIDIEKSKLREDVITKARSFDELSDESIFNIGKTKVGLKELCKIDYHTGEVEELIYKIELMNMDWKCYLVNCSGFDEVSSYVIDHQRGKLVFFKHDRTTIKNAEDLSRKIKEAKEFIVKVNNCLEGKQSPLEMNEDNYERVLNIRQAKWKYRAYAFEGLLGETAIDESSFNEKIIFNTLLNISNSGNQDEIEKSIEEDIKKGNFEGVNRTLYIIEARNPAPMIYYS